MKLWNTMSTEQIIEWLHDVANSSPFDSDERGLANIAADRLRDLYFGDIPSPTPDVLERVRTELAFAEQRKYLAVAIDIADLKALLAAVGGADA